MKMIKVITFFALLAISLFLILYSQYDAMLILELGKSKISLNFWFAMVLLILSILCINWISRHIRSLWGLPGVFRDYRYQRSLTEMQHARGQAVMQALSGDYQAAVRQMSARNLEDLLLSDWVLYATWLNQVEKLQELENVLSKMQASGKVPDGWMIWFRAYLLHERNQERLACEVLLDALNHGIYSPQIVKAFAAYIQPDSHYQDVMSHVGVLRRYLTKPDYHQLLIKCATAQLDHLIKQSKQCEISAVLSALPKAVSQHESMGYYRIEAMLVVNNVDGVMRCLREMTFSDKRLVAQLMSLDVDLADKIKLVEELLLRQVDHPDLLYVLSYLHAQAGEVGDTVKLLEQAIHAK